MLELGSVGHKDVERLQDRCRREWAGSAQNMGKPLARMAVRPG